MFLGPSATTGGHHASICVTDVFNLKDCADTMKRNTKNKRIYNTEAKEKVKQNEKQLWVREFWLNITF